MKAIHIIIILSAVFSSLTAYAADSLRVSVATCYPGSEVYELEGHTALHIEGQYQGQDIDVAINYGVFDFNAPNFIYRFVKGETDYSCGVSDWDRFLYHYRLHNRRVTEQPILLDSLQTQRLMDLLTDNLREENRTYRYNYVLDNCATRPLRIIEKAIGDTIIVGAPEGYGKGDTFRNMMRAYHKNYPWYQFGIDLALGSGIDRKITQREATFSPEMLSRQLEEATSLGHKIAQPAITVVEGTPDATLPSTPWYLTPLAAGWTLFAITTLLTIYDVRARRRSRGFDAVLFGIYGIAGLVLTFLIFISQHYATSPNWLYLWLNPLCLAVPILIWLKKFKKAIISYLFINFALILTMAVAWPLCGQSGNAAFVPLIGCDLMRTLFMLTAEMRSKGK